MKNFFTLPLICVLIMLGINAQTTAFAIVGPPTTQASDIVITNLTATSATISWTNGNGTNRVVFVENPSLRAEAPANAETYIASTDWNAKGSKLPNSNYYCVYNGSGNSVTITNLIPESVFSVRISEYNGSDKSTQYLTDIYAVTGNPYVFDTPVAPPTVQASNIVITNLTSTTATISWTNGNGENRVVTLENPGGTAAAPYDGVPYTASTDWNVKGTQLGTSNYYCVYNGFGNTVTVTNLIPNSKFTVRISEYNGTPGNEAYLKTTVTGNPKVFYTLVSPPAIQASNIIVTNLTSKSATISWSNGDGAKRVVFVENPFGTAAAPYNSTTYTASTDWNSKGTQIGTSNYYCVYNGSGISVSLTNLTPDSRYTVRISEYNGSAGSENNFVFENSTSGNPHIFNTPVSTDIQPSDVIALVTISPNPTSGIITVKSNREISGMDVTISSITGNEVYKTTTLQNSVDVDLTGQADGIYIVKVEINGVSTFCKVVKK